MTDEKWIVSILSLVFAFIALGFSIASLINVCPKLWNAYWCTHYKIANTWNRLWGKKP
jgi:hypothetical protein